MNTLDNNFFEKQKKTIQLSMKQDTVSLYLVNLNKAKKSYTKLFNTLTKEEQNHADSYIVTKAKEQFVISQGILRHLLSIYLEIPPQELLIYKNTHGKPHIYNKDGVEFFFNKSHSGDFAFYGFTYINSIGVDIEQKREIENLDLVMDKVFSQKELLRFSKLSLEEKNNLFFKYWSCKESYIKAIGLGLYKDPKCIDFYISEKKNLARILFVDKERTQSYIKVRLLNPVTNYTAAFCLLGHCKNISFFNLN